MFLPSVFFTALFSAQLAARDEPPPAPARAPITFPAARPLLQGMYLGNWETSPPAGPLRDGMVLPPVPAASVRRRMCVIVPVNGATRAYVQETGFYRWIEPEMKGPETDKGGQPLRWTNNNSTERRVVVLRLIPPGRRTQFNLAGASYDFTSETFELKSAVAYNGRILAVISADPSYSEFIFPDGKIAWCQYLHSPHAPDCDGDMHGLELYWDHIDGMSGLTDGTVVRRWSSPRVRDDLRTGVGMGGWVLSLPPKASTSPVLAPVPVPSPQTEAIVLRPGRLAPVPPPDLRRPYCGFSRGLKSGASVLDVHAYVQMMGFSTYAKTAGKLPRRDEQGNRLFWVKSRQEGEKIVTLVLTPPGRRSTFYLGNFRMILTAERFDPIEVVAENGTAMIEQLPYDCNAEVTFPDGKVAWCKYADGFAYAECEGDVRGLQLSWDFIRGVSAVNDGAIVRLWSKPQIPEKPLTGLGMGTMLIVNK